MAHIHVLAWSIDEVTDVISADRHDVTVKVTQTGLPDGQVEIKVSGDRRTIEQITDMLDVDHSEIEE